jgi:hypothetical protein
LLAVCFSFLFLYLCQQPALSRGCHVACQCVAKFTHTMLQFGTNHVVNGSFYRDVNIKLKDHYLFLLHRDISQKDFFSVFW